MENHIISVEQTDEQLISWNNVDVDFNADVQKREELLVQSIPGATDDKFQLLDSTMGTISGIHSATAITMGTEETGDNYPIFGSACLTVLTSSMLNCRECEEYVIPIMQAEFGVQMESTHECNKTYYCAGRDGSIHTLEFDVLIASVKQDLIGGRAVTNGLDFQVILNKNPNICGIYPRINGKLCGVEHLVHFISDDCRMIRVKTDQLVHSTVLKLTGFDLWHSRLVHMSYDSTQRTVEHSIEIKKFPKNISVAMTKTGEACLRATANNIPAAFTAAGEEGPSALVITATIPATLLYSENKAQYLVAAPTMGTTSAVSNYRLSLISLACGSMITDDCMEVMLPYSRLSKSARTKREGRSGTPRVHPSSTSRLRRPSAESCSSTRTFPCGSHGPPSRTPSRWPEAGC